jgi:DNA/RNA endonuclease YhcR with UshA esterase domain
MSLRRASIVLFAALALCGANLSLAAVSSIAAARALPVGSVVSIRGTVTVPAGSFASSTFDQGFAVQDATGGIYVTMSDNAGLIAGRHVRVRGTLGDDGYGLVVLRVAGVGGVRRIAGTANPAPLPVATGALGEATEGVLLDVSGTVTRGPTNDMPYGYSVFIDDGSGETQVFIPASTGINPYRIPYAVVGNRIRVVGFGGQFNDQYEVLPRFPSDIQPLP